jgi:hypothetical protein
VQADPSSEVSRVFLSVAEALVEKVLKDHFERTGGQKLPAGKGPTRLKIMR